MDGIAAKARQWLAHSKKELPVHPEAHEHIVESLLAEIKRLESINEELAEEVYRLRNDGVQEIRRAVAEECAVLCETADYLIRSYGCAKEIRKQFGVAK